MLFGWPGDILKGFKQVALIVTDQC
jgi:hypothetical protein